MGGRGGYSGTTANSSSRMSPLEAFRDNATQSTKEQKMVERVLKLWYNNKGK